ncbi:MAG: hypothetical protein WBD07_18600 [Vicinamibacterales bacterium]
MLVAALLLNIMLAGLGQGQQPTPVPRPFPGSGPATPRPAPQRPTAPATPPAPTAPPAPAAPAPARDADQPEAVPTSATLGMPIYPAAQFIRSYYAGGGQRYYIFGSSASFADIVAYYRNVLKQKGDVLFEVPATHQFDVGKFDPQTMAFQPGVTVKDFQSEVSKGFPNPTPGALPERFPTIIQIVPAK